MRTKCDSVNRSSDDRNSRYRVGSGRADSASTIVRRMAARSADSWIVARVCCSASDHSRSGRSGLVELRDQPLPGGWGLRHGVSKTAGASPYSPGRSRRGRGRHGRRRSPRGRGRPRAADRGCLLSCHTPRVASRPRFRITFTDGRPITFDLPRSTLKVVNGRERTGPGTVYCTPTAWKTVELIR